MKLRLFILLLQAACPLMSSYELIICSYARLLCPDEWQLCSAVSHGFRVLAAVYCTEFDRIYLWLSPNGDESKV